MGKTATMLTMAYHLARAAQATEGCDSLEMSREQLLHRLLAIETGRLHSPPSRDSFPGCCEMEGKPISYLLKHILDPALQRFADPVQHHQIDPLDTAVPEVRRSVVGQPGAVA